MSGYRHWLHFEKEKKWLKTHWSHPIVFDHKWHPSDNEANIVVVMVSHLRIWYKISGSDQELCICLFDRGVNSQNGEFQITVWTGKSTLYPVATNIPLWEYTWWNRLDHNQDQWFEPGFSWHLFIRGQEHTVKKESTTSNPNLTPEFWHQ